MTADPFAGMRAALAPAGPVAPAGPAARTQVGQAEPGASRCARMRNALRGGPRSAAELAAAGEVSTSLVYALLKHDIQQGRIARRACAGGTRYELAPGFDADLQRRLAQARQLLQRHGFTVTKEDRHHG